MTTSPAGIVRVRLWLLAWAIVALAGLAALTVLVLARAGAPFAVDQLWQDLMTGLRAWLPLWPALVLNGLGGGVLGVLVVPILAILALLLWRRWWAALYFAAASAAGAGAVQLLKHAVGRARPGEMLVQSDPGSFPSGHAANAAVIAVVLAVVFARARVIVLGTLYTVGMMFSRTFLSVHWLSDTFAGMLLGVAVALTLAALLAGPLLLERGRQHPAPWSAH